MTGHPALDIDSVSKGFGAVDILRQVSVRVEPGTVVAIVGHNGAGKTTLLRMAQELDVLGLVGHGLSNSEIAQNMHISEGTAKTHVSRILAKLHCSNRVQAAIIAHDARNSSDAPE